MKGTIETKSASASFVDLASGNPTAKRFVVFLDIMGFKDRVARYKHAIILEDLKQLANFISDNIRMSGLIFTMFSDSVIILSMDDKYNTFKKLIELTNAVVEKSIELKIPIKGAIASGECTVLSGEKSLYFGQPIIDAYMLEENAELYNVVLHHTVEDNAIKLSEELKGYLFDCNVKLKGGQSKHYVLAWFAKQLGSSKANLQSIRASVSDSPRRYIDNTLKCIETYEKAEES